MLDAIPIDVGTMVGSYRVHRVLAEGGMAMVYEAAHVILPRRVALKVMHASLATHPFASQRILQEACILEAFAHPGAVRVYECGMLPDRRPWIAMELLGGQPLTSYLASRGALSSSDLIGMLTTIVGVLAAAHRSGIVHRDLKPENILVVGPGLENVRVIDWGIARQPVSCARLTMENFTLGTPTYMAPEQAQGHLVDGRADVYGLGIMAFEAAAGTPPFHADNPIELVMKHLQQPPPSLKALRPDLPDGLIQLIERMLVKDRAARPTAEMVQVALARLAAQAAKAQSEQVELVIPDDAAYEEMTLSEAADDDAPEIELSMDDLEDQETAVELSVDADDEAEGDGEVDKEVLDEDDLDGDQDPFRSLRRRTRLNRRWTPQHLVATPDLVRTAPIMRAQSRAHVVGPRARYDFTSGVFGGTIGGRNGNKH